MGRPRDCPTLYPNSGTVADIAALRICGQTRTSATAICGPKVDRQQQTSREFDRGADLHLRGRVHCLGPSSGGEAARTRGTSVFRIIVELISALKSHHRGRSGLSRPSVGGAHAAIRPSPTLGNLPNTFSLRARSTISRRHGSPAHYEGFTRALWPWSLQAARLRP